jgi:hypothetical protein
VGLFVSNLSTNGAKKGEKRMNPIGQMCEMWEYPVLKDSAGSLSKKKNLGQYIRKCNTIREIRNT